MQPTIRAMIKANDDGDVWGDTMGSFFSIASAFYLNGGCGMGNTYQPWGFRASPLLRDDDAHREEDPMMARLLDLLDDGEITMSDLRHAGDVLSRYSRILEAQGRSY